ncbi:putative quinol monooxygenase [Jeotgalibacillus aurantiacus]|uniref:putative quinol monooxygenase n=1 Tax=Jeotgalibacillus aurantiacus TaxID=2763266 RepID=UPI001D0B8C10|nr:putative quinol monooxygenase [Jeotgalibacillus aurantiacus]
MIIIQAILTAKEGHEAALREVVQDVVAPSRLESGCVLYTLHESTENEGTFVFYEKWADQEAFEAHMNSEHYLAYREKSAAHTESRVVHRLKEL